MMLQEDHLRKALSMSLIRPSYKMTGPVKVRSSTELKALNLGYSGSSKRTVSSGDIILDEKSMVAWVVATEGAADADLATSDGWPVDLKWLDIGAYTLDYFDIDHEASPSTDQTSKVQAMLDFLEGKEAQVRGTAKVGISSALLLKSGSRLSIPGLTLFLLASFTSAYATQSVVADGTNDIVLQGVTIDGNSAAFGGLFDGGSIAAVAGGFMAYNGAQRVHFVDCVASGVNSNGFMAYGGGDSTSEPTDITFTRCRATDCGVCFTQEVQSTKAASVLTNVGPQRIVYDNCTAEGNFGLYVAGGDAEVRGGSYLGYLKNCLTVYVGDALAPLRFTATGVKFSQETGAVPLALLHSIAANASTVNTYQKQQTFDAEFNHCEFETDQASNCARIETGCRVTMNHPKFIGGVSQLLTIDTALTGTFDLGQTTVIMPEFTAWTGTSTYAATLSLPTRMEKALFHDPAGTTPRGVFLDTNDRRYEFEGTVFGTATETKAVHTGFTGSPTNAKIHGTDLGTVSSVLFNFTSSVAYGLNIQGSIPVDPFDVGPGAYPGVTAAQIADITSYVNTTNKYAGKIVRDTTNQRLMMAAGDTAGHAWYVVDGSVTVTPA